MKTKLLLIPALAVALSGCIVVVTGDPASTPTTPIDSIASSQLVYSSTDPADGSHFVHLLKLDGSSNQVVAIGWNPHLAPNGKAFSFQRDGEYPSGKGDHLFVRNLETSSEQNVMNGSDYMVSAGWTIDSQALIFDEQCSLGRVTLEGSSVTTLRDANCFDDAPNVNPVTGQIVFHNANFAAGGLWIMDASGGNAKQIAGTLTGDAWPAWSPDGKAIVFLRTNASDLYKGVLHTVKPDGTSDRALSDLKTDSSNFVRPTAAWTPDGRGIIAAVVAGGQSSVRLIATKTSEKPITLKVPNAESVDFIGNIAPIPAK